MFLSFNIPKIFFTYFVTKHEHSRMRTHTHNIRKSYRISIPFQIKFSSFKSSSSLYPVLHIIVYTSPHLNMNSEYVFYPENPSGKTNIFFLPFLYLYFFYTCALSQIYRTVPNWSISNSF